MLPMLGNRLAEIFDFFVDSINAITDWREIMSNP